MTWFRLDDGWWSHRKTLMVSDAASGLFCKLGCYSSAHLTDGIVPRAVVATLTHASTDVYDGLLAELAEVGFVHLVVRRNVPVVKIHDFLVYNPSRKEVMRERAKRAEAGRKGGVNAHKSRGHLLEADAKQVLEAKNESCSAPVPARPGPSRPVPTKEEQEGVGSLAGFIAAEHLALMQSIRKSKALLPDSVGSVEVEPLLRPYDRATIKAILRSFVLDSEAWLADERRRWALHWLNAERITRYLTPAQPKYRPEEYVRPEVDD